MTFGYDPAQVRNALLAIAIALTAVSVAVQLLLDPLGAKNDVITNDFVELGLVLHSAEEPSLANAFSTLVLLGCAFVTAAIGKAKLTRREPYARHWLALAAIILFFAIDEGSGLHEATIVPFQELFDASGPFLFTWVIPAIVFAGAFGLIFMRFFLDLPGRIRFELVLGLVLFLGAAIGLEMAEGVLYENRGFDSFEFAFAITFEELIEMCGLALVAYALLTELADGVGALVIEREFRA